MLQGLNHVTLGVRDVAASLAFYVDLLGCALLARWPEGAYLRAGDVWLALLADAHARSGPLPEYSHVAFSVAPEGLDDLRARLAAAGVREWQENRTEGASLYVLDPTGHKLELHVTDLGARLRAALDAPWPGLELTPLGRSLATPPGC